MLLLSEKEVDGIIRHRRAQLLAGLALISLPFALPPGWGIGLFSGFTLFSLSVYGMAFRRWRTEPGLWMFAVLLIVTLGPCWAYFEYLHWSVLFEARPPGQPARAITWEQMRLPIDAAVALVIFERVVRLAMTVAIENWKRTRQMTGRR